MGLLGILLALGRRSKLPIVHTLCVFFIEFARGVPLITVLFMASIMFALFMPEGISFDKLLRALVGVALFAGAYMAETIRGGLQAIPRGQGEAAASLGLSGWQTQRKVVLPQALKISIPPIVNSFIALFKDTAVCSVTARPSGMRPSNCTRRLAGCGVAPATFNDSPVVLPAPRFATAAARNSSQSAGCR